MSSNVRAAAVILGALAAGSTVWAHRATERYIPIGASPGVSGELSVIGTVEAVSPDDAMVHVVVDDRTIGVHCYERTRFWLDRTRIRRTNLAGSLEDCREGRRVEIRFVDDDRGAAVAAWVKIEVLEE